MNRREPAPQASAAASKQAFARSDATAAERDPAHRFGPPFEGWRLSLYKIIFEAETPGGRAFDLALIWLILASVAVVMLDSFESLNARWGQRATHAAFLGRSI